MFCPTQGPAGPTISGFKSSIFVTPQFLIEFVISSAMTKDIVSKHNIHYPLTRPYSAHLLLGQETDRGGWED